MLELLTGKASGQGSSELAAGYAESTDDRPGSQFSQPLNDDQLDNLRIEQLGKDFLKDAIETYNDADSGYQLSPAFKQLKDRAEGRLSDRQMANLGGLSKKLLEGSADFFDPESASNTRRADGVRPGQRLDQLLAAAAEKAVARNDGSSNEENSVLSDALNNALGAALDQAVTIADKKHQDRIENGFNTYTSPSQTPSDNLSIQDQLNSITDFGDPASDTASNFGSDLNSSTSSDSDSSVDNAAASIADSMSQMKFDGWKLIYAAGLISILAVAVYLIFRLVPTADENVLKQRELQRKLQNKSANSNDVVEAVDLFLLSRFGAASSWWNSKHATDQITTSQPDWREKVSSLFQVYRWSRYQADGNASVSAEQNELVNSTLLELSRSGKDSDGRSTSVSKSNTAQSSDADDEATS